MKRRNLVLIILLNLVLLNANYAQNKRTLRAYETFNAGEYFKAIDLFKDAYQKVTDKKEKLDIAFYIAECYRKTNKSREAALWYGKVIAKNYEKPIIYLYYADALKMNEEYEEAKNQYEKYKELVPGDARGSDGILSCNMALEWMEFPNGYVVEEMKFFNSKFSDYSPAYGRDDYRLVLFTSTRDETLGKMEHGGTGQGFADIFTSTMDRKGKWSTPVPLNENINTESEEGTPSVSSDFNTLYFTRCTYNKKKAEGCNIWVAKRDGDQWDKAKSIPFFEDSLVAAHPAISPDELTLYFVSDAKGSVDDGTGKPSKDIWRVTRSGPMAEWGNPENLGTTINTPGDELFPYVHHDGTLYFSSDGHIGMGGLDIFKATKQDNGQWKVENLKYPINSSSDDFGIVFEAEREAGFLSSTRKGKVDAIYAFMLPPLKFSITGVVIDEKTDLPIPQSTIKSISSDGITLESKAGEDGTFKFLLKPGTDYVFLASKDGYLQGKERETTKGLDKSTEFKTEIYLSSIKEPIRLENIFFELDKADLRPESMVSLDKLVETLNDNPNVTIELGAHTDSRASDEYNFDLSKRRAQSVVNYLISKGIKRDRLEAKGYGESKPKTVDAKDHESYPFLPVNTLLTESFINKLPDADQQELAHFLNRRTEFRVLRTDYGE
ncbi:MAG: OmpA family protein [Bacteroidales bacterium]|nr:OmpA family protein [Bacteroidales bacterium]